MKRLSVSRLPASGGTYAIALSVLLLVVIGVVVAQGALAITLENPLGANVTIAEIFARVIRTILGVVGSIALLMFMYGGFMWLTSAGDSKKIDTGRQTMVWATLGLLVIFSSYAIANFVFSAISGSVGDGGDGRTDTPGPEDTRTDTPGPG